ncbi:MAG TPA: peptidoglycan-binding domain-containing protein [Polyangia bacterium]|nr:peptidoglycan-binding domain-containing protein [Polyangia bacterium]
MIRLTRRFSALGPIVMAAAVAGCVHTHATPPPPAAVPPTKPDHEVAAETGVPVASTPQGLMHDGAERLIQERLRAKGLLKPAQVTGRFDSDTHQALREFQKREGLPTTGLPSFETVEHLGLKLDLVFRSTGHTEDRGHAPRRGAVGPGSAG